MLDVGKTVAEDPARPTSKSIGDNLGLTVDGVMGWLGYGAQSKPLSESIACGLQAEDYRKSFCNPRRKPTRTYNLNCRPHH